MGIILLGGDIMDKVPKMISTKDISYIADMFEWSFLISKKACCYSKEVVDKKIQKELKDVSDIHKGICEDLLKVLG